MQDKFQVGAIASVHGIKGEVKVFPTTDEPAKFKKLKSVILKTEKEEREIALQSVRFFKNMVIVKFQGVESPEDAQKYRGATLWIAREQAVPLRENEYYRADLIGLSVVTEDGEELGILTDVLETGANDVYEVTLSDKRTALFPAIRDCIREVDVEKGYIKVHVMEGLLS
ncbi:16S rRNA processing protein RimM [bacterium 1XD8-76]|nr:16S rRNA processing protein RimM [bacterium 1XD8-76]